MYHYKAMFRDRENIQRFCENYGIGQFKTRFLTLTYSRRLTKAESSAMWNSFRTALKKELLPDLQYIAVWELTKKKNWHMHVLLNGGCSNEAFRAFYDSFRLGSRRCFGFGHLVWTHGTASKVANYMSKYMTKENRLKKIRYCAYSLGWARKVSSLFSFHGGLARRWRLCCEQINKLFPQSFKFFYQYADFERKRIAFSEYCRSPRDFLRFNTQMVSFFKHSEAPMKQAFINDLHSINIMCSDSSRPALFWSFAGGIEPLLKAV
jgi:hypothetical protein